MQATQRSPYESTACLPLAAKRCRTEVLQLIVRELHSAVGVQCQAARRTATTLRDAVYDGVGETRMRDVVHHYLSASSHLGALYELRTQVRL